MLSSLPQGGLAFSSYFNAVEVLTEAVAGFLEARYPKLYNITTAEDSKQLREGLKWAFCLVHSRALHNQRSGVPPCKFCSQCSLTTHERLRFVVDELVLIPGFDSTNHNNAPGAADELQFSQVGNGISQIRQIASRFERR